ncbi:hypothetical protein SAMN02745704_02104 [Paucidesulfovibrio gracilis DSM 16080]|uniref:Sugar phosphate isomerase/epimerase n=1 Tax=Paucidesulfovibrio gracilis DSM 16080 TaxID=1121449 RepID=A0A1T4XFF2_9BACT|nr:cobamide remodeling phosphodiesterase CbiR [Paucidesulfovibrio gracilis]SKA88312.1 hypothetical protein SAMN02745704_02104 [Paucidesulfovibrio gracilis DSM 16080]
MPKNHNHENQAACTNGGKPFPFRIAAPSWLHPGPVSENCAWIADNLAHTVDEVALMFLETESCLAYSREELLPPWLQAPSLPADELPETGSAFTDDELAALTAAEADEDSVPKPDLSFHVHLPLDLPWDQGFNTAWRKIEALIQKAEPMHPRRYVLHPPPQGVSLRMLAGQFAAAGVKPRRVLLENIQGCDLSEIWPEVLDSGFGACVDLGHILLYSQFPMLALPGLGERVDMLHLSAPDPFRPGRHLPLSHLDDNGRLLLRSMLDALTPGATVVLEVFDADGFQESLETLWELVPPKDSRS